MPASIVEKTMNGPWGSQYVVNGETLAVNLACFSAGEGINVDEALSTMLAWPATTNPSIREFWAEQMSVLTDRQRAEVVDRAKELRRIDDAAGYGSPESLFERFDGQR